MSDLTTDNPFARVLLFYYLYLRVKLVPSDLDKIARKYGTKQSKLLVDLQQKYTFEIPCCVPYLQLDMICHVYNVPSSIKVLIGLGNRVYSPASDIYSPEFDAMHCIKWNTISASHLKAPSLDNITKLLPYLPNSEVELRPQSLSANRISINSATESSATGGPVEQAGLAGKVGGVIAQPKSKHMFEVIAQYSLHSHKRGSPAPSSDSPLALLCKFMEERIRVRIIIRRDHRYIRTFSHTIVCLLRVNMIHCFWRYCT